MSDWEPATDAEAAMREALSADDQDLYFRILARTELLLPVSAEAVRGQEPAGWGTWTSDNRIHVLAFTSGPALRACLGSVVGSFRRAPFQELAADWPNQEWWLAVNPGLAIEAYLPAWYIAELNRGDIQLPGRTMGMRARIARSEMASMAQRARSAAAAPVPLPRSPTSSLASMTTPVEDVAAQAHTERSQFAVADLMQTIEVAAVEEPGAPAPATGEAPEEPDVEEPALASPWLTSDHERYETDSAEPETVSWATPEPDPMEPVVAPEPMPVAEPVPAPVAEAVSAPVAVPVPAPADGAVGSTSGISGSLGSSTPDSLSATSASPVPDSPPAPSLSRASESPSDLFRSSAAGRPSAADAWAAGFVPANRTEASLLVAAQANNTDEFLSTLLLARVIVPVPAGTSSLAHPSAPDFPWRLDEVDGQPFLCVFTSPERFNEHTATRLDSGLGSVSLRFLQLIGAWPNPEIAFSVNPGSPIGATLPGTQIVALAGWAAEVGLRDEPSGEVMVATPAVSTGSSAGVAGASKGQECLTVMQKVVAPDQLSYYLERGYDRVSGFVQRASEVERLTTPQQLYQALGLGYSDSPFREDLEFIYVLRWVAHRPDLYRIPYGGQNEEGMQAMQGWVIERPPFRGNGFAPGETSDVIAEFKVDSVRLPHQAEIWRRDRDGIETLVATFDADKAKWFKPEYGWRDAGR